MTDDQLTFAPLPPPKPVAEPVLVVRDLTVSFDTRGGAITPVEGVSFELRPSEVLAIVGESGSGKTVTALSIARLIHGAKAELSGEVMYGGRNLLALTEKEMRAIRGAEISMIFQDPMTSLNPLARVGDQILEMLKLHAHLSPKEARARVVALLEEVGIAQAQERGRFYPHEFSGGMRQRVMIALAMACNPKVLIADEPTTALDVTIQAQIVDLIRRQATNHGTATILITHDLGVVAEVADRIAVMYAGRIVEHGSCESVFGDPQHPYTWGLLSCVPRPDRPRTTRMTTIEGSPPSPYAFPAGCRFRTRCKHAFARCVDLPRLAPQTHNLAHASACWLTEAERAPRRKGALGSDALF